MTQDRNLSGYLKENTKRYLPSQPWNASDQSISRSDLLFALMFHDSGYSANLRTTVASVTLHDIDLTGQLALERPMLVAQIKPPASRLVLAGAPRPPRIDRTTMLRVILPLKVKP